MLDFDALQQMVEAYKASPDDALRTRIRDRLARHCYDHGVRGLDEDALQDLVVTLFAPARAGGSSAFERSLADYDPAYRTPEGGQVSFYAFFSRVVGLRALTAGKRDAERAMLPDAAGTKARVQLWDPQAASSQHAASAPDATAEVLRGLLVEELRPLLKQALEAVENPAQRDPLLFVLFFPNTLSHREVAALFGIRDATINSNLKRGAERFAAALLGLVRERFAVDLDALRAALRSIGGETAVGIAERFPDPRERALIEMRFAHGAPRAEVLARHGIDDPALAALERRVLAAFLEMVTAPAPRAGSERSDDMAFYELFRDFLAEPPRARATRAALPLDGATLAGLELFKEAFPDTAQALARRLTAAAALAGTGELARFCELHEVPAARLALTLDDPAAYPAVAAELAAFLGLAAAPRPALDELLARAPAAGAPPA